MHGSSYLKNDIYEDRTDCLFPITLVVEVWSTQTERYRE